MISQLTHDHPIQDEIARKQAVGRMGGTSVEAFPNFRAPFSGSDAFLLLMLVSRPQFRMDTGFTQLCTRGSSTFMPGHVSRGGSSLSFVVRIAGRSRACQLRTPETLPIPRWSLCQPDMQQLSTSAPRTLALYPSQPRFRRTRALLNRADARIAVRRPDFLNAAAV